MKINNKYIDHKLILCHNFKNVMEIFKINKVVLNFGVKSAVQLPKRILVAGLALNFITFNKVLPCISKKSVMVLKVREGMVIGCKKTLRKFNLIDFLNLFFKKLLLRNFELKSFKSNINKVSKDFSFSIEDLFIFKSLEYFFDLFVDLPELNISIKFNKGISLYDKLNFLKIYGFKNIKLI